jgi:hypothetical protein
MSAEVEKDLMGLFCGNADIFSITPMPVAGTTKDENGVVAINGESR